jgi:SAM-dependent methyltransferase
MRQDAFWSWAGNGKGAVNMDIRKEAAAYYDYGSPPFDDLAFYKEHIPSPNATILELGCGTGRVLTRLSDLCGSIHGIDISDSMLAICREKLSKAGIPPEKARVETGDITNLDLGKRFDLIIAPYRVFQNLETDMQVDGFFRSVGKHLAPNGSCILNVFHPWSVERIQEMWGTGLEHSFGEAPVPGGRITRHALGKGLDLTKQILYPELIYRRYEGDCLVDETRLKICMRYYYPEQFEKLVTDHGFTITGRWGGYKGEPYGQGQELVLQFRSA